MAADSDLYWQLDYASGLSCREPVTHASLRTADRGAVALHLLAGVTPVFSVDLRPDWRPVFYRKRHSDLAGATGSALDATVFGRVKASEDLPDPEAAAVQAEDGTGGQRRRFSGQLWLARDGYIVDCPAEHIDPQMIAVLAMGA